MSGLVARILITDPERRPSAREVQESITVIVNRTENNAPSSIDKSLNNISLNKNTLLVTSSGPAAEYWGGMLGVYKKAGTHNNCPYYKQVDFERSDGKEMVIYRRKEGGWAVRSGLDGPHSLENTSKTESVPLTGWTFWDGDNKQDRDDPHLRISPDQPPACGEITISASGGAADKQYDCVGVYKPTQMFSAGRRVIKHKTPQARYLLVVPGRVVWSVRESVESKGARMQSGCAPSIEHLAARTQISPFHRSVLRGPSSSLAFGLKSNCMLSRIKPPAC